MLRKVAIFGKRAKRGLLRRQLGASWAPVWPGRGGFVVHAKNIDPLRAPLFENLGLMRTFH